LESVFPSNLLSSAALLSSGFDARYGDRQGAVLELNTASPRPGIHGGLTASEIALGAWGSAGLGFQASARRGFLDLVLPSRPELTEVPRYQDYLAQARFAWPAGGETEVLAFGSQDSTGFFDPQSPDKAYGWESFFHTAGLRVVWQPWAGWSAVSLASASYSRVFVNLTGQHFDQRPYEWYLRQEADWSPAEDHQLNLGFEWRQTRTMLDADFARIPTDLGSGFSYASYSAVSVDALGSKGVTSGWLQDRWQVMEPLWVSLGGRFDSVDSSGESFFAPRLSGEWRYDERTTWKASLGDYFQSLQPLETVPGWALSGLRSDVTRTLTLGLEKRPLQGHTVSLEYYHKDFSRFLPNVDTSGNSTAALGSGVDSSGNSLNVNRLFSGFSDGVEFTWRMEPKAGFLGWISYAYNFTEKAKLLAVSPAQADFDQPHVFNLVASWQPDSRWEFGLRQRLASGIPYTPVVSRSYDPSTNTWTPTYGATNSARLDWYHRLDLRAAYGFGWGAWRLKAFLECLNVYDQPNVTAVAYRDDYSGLQEVRQFPRIFFAGLEGEF
jgi:hypothetical protein